MHTKLSIFLEKEIGKRRGTVLFFYILHIFLFTTNICVIYFLYNEHMNAFS